MAGCITANACGFVRFTTTFLTTQAPPANKHGAISRWHEKRNLINQITHTHTHTQKAPVKKGASRRTVRVARLEVRERGEGRGGPQRGGRTAVHHLHQVSLWSARPSGPVRRQARSLRPIACSQTLVKALCPVTAPALHAHSPSPSPPPTSLYFTKPLTFQPTSPSIVVVVQRVTSHRLDVLARHLLPLSALRLHHHVGPTAGHALPAAA